MPTVTLVNFTGLRVGEQRLAELGMSLPGLAPRGEALSKLPGLGLLTLGSLTPEPWRVTYHDSVDDPETLCDAVLSDAPDLVALSALTASVEEAYALGDRLRKRRVPVVLGGLHATALPDEAALHADSVVVGAGEGVWPHLLRDFSTGNFRRVYRSTEYPSAWAAPRFDLLPSEPARYTLQTQRGCPFACEFCGASRLLGAFAEKPAALIAAELETIASRAARSILELADDNTFAGGRDHDELLDAFAASGVRYFTESDWRVGERPDLVAKIAASGCVQLLIGIESAVFRYPGMGAKNAEWSRLLDAIHTIQEAGIAVTGCFILGADGETRASVDRLVEFLEESPFAELQLTLQTPFPGTPLYRRLKNDGRLLPDRGWWHYTLFDVTYRPDTMSVSELAAAFEGAVVTTFRAEVAQRRRRLRNSLWKRNPALRTGA